MGKLYLKFQKSTKQNLLKSKYLACMLKSYKMTRWGIPSGAVEYFLNGQKSVVENIKIKNLSYQTSLEYYEKTALKRCLSRRMKEDAI